MDEAEERTLRYYCIPPHRWQQLRYDLVTRQDQGWEPLPGTLLARVQRLCHTRTVHTSAFDFYRIQLNDPGILTTAQREKLETDLYPFLMYILTHEMVHLVRLTSILPEREDLHVSTEEEENRVQRVAYHILSEVRDEPLRAILTKFENR